MRLIPAAQWLIVEPIVEGDATTKTSIAIPSQPFAVLKIGKIIKIPEQMIYDAIDYVGSIIIYEASKVEEVMEDGILYHLVHNDDLRAQYTEEQ